MRTTLTLDPDVAKLVTDEVHRSRRPFKQVVNDALRQGLAPKVAPRTATRYRVIPHATKLVAGLDRLRLNALVDEWDTAAEVAKLGRSSRAAERRAK